MKVSDNTKANHHERRPLKTNTENGRRSIQGSASSGSVKVRRTSETKNDLQTDAKSGSKLKDTSKKYKKFEKSPEGDTSIANRKPWIQNTRRPSKPETPASIIEMELSLLDPNKACEKIPHSPTLHSSHNEKQRRKQKTVNQNYAKSVITSDNALDKSGAVKKPKVILKRQLALDNVPSNLKESYSVSDESLNSITSVTQLLKIERSSFAFNTSSNNSNSAYDDVEEEEIATGGVKSLAARWQARSNNNDSINQNGILLKHKSSENARSNKTNDNESSKTKLFQAIKQNVLQKNLMNATETTKEEYTTAARSESKTKRFSMGHISPSLPKPEVDQPQKKTKTRAQSLTTTSEISSALLRSAVALVTNSTTPTERKTLGTKISQNSSLQSSSQALSNKQGTTGVVTAKKSKELSVSVEKNETSTLNKSKPRSRSTSPIKSNNIASAGPSNKVASSATGITTPLLSRGRSTNRRATVIDTTANLHTKSSTKAFNQDQQQQNPRRSRSVSSTPGLPSYAAATTTSLAKQSNQIRDHNKEEFTRTNRSTSYHKSPLINANNNSGSISGNATNTAAAISTNVARGQGQQKNVPLKKNRISDSHSSARKNDTEQTNASLLLKSANSRIKTSSVTSNSSSLSLSSAAAASPSLPLSSTTRARNKKSDTKHNSSNDNDSFTKVEKGSKRKSDASNNNKTDGKAIAVASNRKKEETKFSPSSFSLTSSSSTTTTSTKTKSATRTKSKQQQRIIPSIIMSEYVDEDNKDGKSTVLAHTKSLFIPLQFIEPLEPTCDIEEGSNLELKVRVKGAEAVIWVKESKIIPNTPPDFEYFQEKASDLYGLRIADVFLEDSGLYICEAYGAGGSEITCWCEVHVLETGSPEDDDEDISWEDLNMSEEIKSPQPLVVPVIVTSQAEQEMEPIPPLETAVLKDNSPIRSVTVKQINSEVDKSSTKLSRKNHLGKESLVDGADSGRPIKDKSKSSSYQQHLKKSSRNESAFSKSFVVAEQTRNEDNKRAEQGARNSAGSRAKSLSSTKLATKTSYNKKEERDMTELTGTENLDSTTNATKETPCMHSDEEIRNDQITNAPTVSVILPTKDDHHSTTMSDANHLQQKHESGKRKLTGELSSASDESIYLKEPRSGDEGAVSSAEENSLDEKTYVTNDEDITTNELVDSPLPPVSSSCSEQNGRSSSVDSAIGFLGRPLFSDGKFPPRILVGPNNIIALYDEVVHLRVKVQNYGIPKTSVNWFKFVNGTYRRIELNSGDQSSSQGEAHMSITRCGTSLNTLTITHVNYDDCGRYRVKVQNLLGMDSHDCLLTVEGPPEPPGTPPKVKYDEKSKTILIQWSSCPYDGGSKITGYYVEASIVQGSKTSINREDLDNWQLLTPQSYSWLCYTLTNPKRGCVYRFRVFGENSYGKGKPTVPSLPLLVPVLMEGRRAGSSDALLWSIKSLSPEDTSFRTDSGRKLVRQQGSEPKNVGDSASVQEEEEPLEYKNVTMKRDSFYNVYEKLDELGKGRFGIVFEVMHKETKKSYAGKFVKCIKAKDKERVQLEVKIMNDLAYHPKLICLIDAFEMPREIVIVTQRIDGGELFERVVADDFTLTEGDCITFLRQICDAVRYIHAKNIMHLDLKPENILCTSKDSNLVKIIDFGLAQYYDPKEPIRVLFGTAEFVSPEIINYEPIAPSTDNWSIGVITYILLSGLSPFMGDNDNETFSNITRAEFDFEDEAFEKISDDAKDFISNLIVKRPEKRLTAEQCLSHRWLKQESVECKKGIILPTDKLKRFLVRRKWQKTGNAIRALSRMTTLYSRRSSSASSTTPTGSMSVSSPPPPSYRHGSLALQESADDNVFFPHSPSSPDNNLSNKINHREKSHIKMSDIRTQSLDDTKTITQRSKFADPSRSDSGVCDIGSFSTSLNCD